MSGIIELENHAWSFLRNWEYRKFIDDVIRHNRDDRGLVDFLTMCLHMHSLNLADLEDSDLRCRVKSALVAVVESCLDEMPGNKLLQDLDDVSPDTKARYIISIRRISELLRTGTTPSEDIRNTD